MSKNDIFHEYAACCLKAALDSCRKRHHNKSLQHFERFFLLLGQYKLCAPEFVEPIPIAATAKDFTFDKLPTDVIPLDLYALACCWRSCSRVEQADQALQKVVDQVSHDKKLAFLRQNLFQEAARYYAEGQQFERADDLLSKQLAIVKVKGSKVLLEFVTTNWLINKGDLHTSRGEFSEAETVYKEALAQIESEWQPRSEQVDLLHSAWNRLEAKRKGQH